MIHSIEEQIILGNRIEALRLLKLISPKKLNKSETLKYLQILRRLGQLREALRVLEKKRDLYPELWIERSIVLGELGALRQAIQILENLDLKQNSSLSISVHYHLGNFYSLLHRYQESLDCFIQMRNIANNLKDSYQESIARLNLCGVQVYLNENQKKVLSSLKLEQKNNENEAFHLLNQGSLYFLSLAALQVGDFLLAKNYSEQAKELGQIHKIRENLLLDLLVFQIDLEIKANSISRSRIYRLHKQVYAQPHLIYKDQLDMLKGRLSISKGSDQIGKNHLMKLIFSGRQNIHTQSGNKILSPHKLLRGDYWEWQKGSPRLISRKALSRRRINPKNEPMLHREGIGTLGSGEISNLQLSLLKELISAMDFGIRDAELWERIWKTPFRLSSLESLKQMVFRIRNSRVGNFVKLNVKDHRISLNLKPHVIWIQKFEGEYGISDSSS